MNFRSKALSGAIETYSLHILSKGEETGNIFGKNESKQEENAGCAMCRSQLLVFPNKSVLQYFIE
jgi:hypothetical protein